MLDMRHNPGVCFFSRFTEYTITTEQLSALTARIKNGRLSAMLSGVQEADRACAAVRLSPCCMRVVHVIQ